MIGCDRDFCNVQSQVDTKPPAYIDISNIINLNMIQKPNYSAFYYILSKTIDNDGLKRVDLPFFRHDEESHV